MAFAALDIPREEMKHVDAVASMVYPSVQEAASARCKLQYLYATALKIVAVAFSQILDASLLDKLLCFREGF